MAPPRDLHTGPGATQSGDAMATRTPTVAGGDGFRHETEREAATLQRVATTGPGKQEFMFADRDLRFTSRFDGGNMESVEQTTPGVFHVRVAEDAAAFGISTGYTTWFYFEIQRGLTSTNDANKPITKHAQEVQLVLANLNPQRGLFMNGYTVMCCSAVVAEEEDALLSPCIFQDEKRWSRLSTPLQFEKYLVPTATTSTQLCPDSGPSSSSVLASESVPDKQQQQLDEDNEGGESGQEAVEPEGGSEGKNKPKLTTKSPEARREAKIRATFTYRFKFARERVRFAFCYPYTYTRVQEELASLDRQFAVPSMLLGELHPNPIDISGSPPLKSPAIYYHRELLVRSLEGLRVDLITISSHDGITSTRGSLPAVLHQGRVNQSQPPTESALQFDCKQKKTVLISARVHSGETPANFMLDGMLRLLLHPTDESAIALRHHFVFKIIPMLNPDGVCQGFYRTDTCGVNLNRVYEDPQPEASPSVFALKELLLQLVDDYGGPNSVAAQENVVYLDLHAHANRRGCFIFGNSHLPNGDNGNNTEASNEAVEAAINRQVQTQLFARLVGLQTPFFDYMACSFDKENMTRHDLRDNNNATTSRRGCSRVALYQATGLTYVYTIECNYNEGRRNLRASSLASPMASSSSAPTLAASTAAGSTRRSSSNGQPRRTQPDGMRLARQTAPPGGSRLYLKYSPAEWTDVGIGAVMALLDLFELPGGCKKLEDSPFRSRDGIRKSLLAEIKAAAGLERTSSGKGIETARQKARRMVKLPTSSKI
ncbi:hypothetical protein BBJ28_00009360 [Nothophytophthora sp. Chile5]|nr:hypothetical protein BBJ28_00009360 [Nothophytophthora sp. Chile5]